MRPDHEIEESHVPTLNRKTRLAAVTAITATVLTGGTGAAMAATNPGSGPAGASPAGSLATARQRADDRITRAENRLSTLETRLTGAKALTPEHVTLLTAEIGQVRSALSTDKARVDAATDLPSLRTAERADGNLRAQVRVVLVQARELRAGDRIAGAVAKSAGRRAALSGRVQQLPAGPAKSAALAKLRDLEATLADASMLARQAVDSAAHVAIRDPRVAKTPLAGARRQLVQARTDLRTARADARAVRRLLAAKHKSGATPAQA
jgi:hypothetical protein